jgi:ankyrin repeat protein
MRGMQLWLPIDRGADIDVKDGDGTTALHWTCLNGHTEIAMAPQCGGRHYKGHRLHSSALTCEEGHTETAMAPHETGADIDAKNNAGCTASTMHVGMVTLRSPWLLIERQILMERT